MSTRARDVRPGGRVIAFLLAILAVGAARAGGENARAGASTTVSIVIAGSQVLDAAPASRLELHPRRARAGTEVTLDASGSADLEGSPLLARFDVDGDGNWDTAYGPLLTTHRYAVVSLFRPRVEVRDEAGNVAQTEAEHETTAESLPPRILLDVTPASVYGVAEANVRVDASRSFDPEGGILAFTYRFGATGLQTAPTHESQASALVAVAFSEAVEVTVTATDPDGQATSATRIVRVISYDHAPAASLELTPGEPAGAYTLDARESSDADRQTAWDGWIAYRYDFEGDGSFDTAWLPFQPTASHVYELERIYTPVVEVRDRFLAVGRATATLELRTPPVFPGGLTGLQATARSCGVSLAWTAAVAPSGPVTYAVYRSQAGAPAGEWTLVATTPLRAHLDRSAPPGARLVYLVRAWTTGEPPLEDPNQVAVLVTTPLEAELEMRAARAQGGLRLTWESAGSRALVLARDERLPGAERVAGEGVGEVTLAAGGLPGSVTYYRLRVASCGGEGGI